jgi:spermidine/putrescine transport system substrate-binding protein
LIVAGGAFAAAIALAACGGGGGGIEGGSDSANVTTVKYQPPPHGDLTISNWPLYIDKNTVSNFDKATGVHTTYIEDVNDNQEFFAKMQPLLAKGQSGGRSMIVVTD